MQETSQPSIWQRLVKWFDNYALFALSLFLIAFIPLNPKIPLWSPIEQYIVRVRLEDLFILLSAVIVGIQVLRRKVQWLTPMFWVMTAYVVVGLISSLVAIFVIQTVPLQTLHIGKTALHFFRYVEYFSLFYIVLASLKTRKQIKIALIVLALTVLSIVLYGYGQKYFYWPVYSTMNREFSKGVRLYLTQYARVQSTFGGHYDMAAYLVVSLPIILALAYQVKNKWASTAMHWIFWGGTWLLILSASRTPFAAFLGGIAGVLLLSAVVKPSWRERVSFFASRSLVVGILTLVLCYYFGSDLIERLGFALNSQPQMKVMFENLDEQRKKYISDETLANSPLSALKLQQMLPKGNPPQGAISTDEVIATITTPVVEEPVTPVGSKSDIPPQPVATTAPVLTGPPPELPAGVYEDIPDVVTVATKSADGTITYVKKQRPRVYSKCALEKELSLCIRQEVLWPRAMEGFLINPLTGSGYATLTKESVEQFTEADSTDNNFLRTLGETGILGFITFYGCVLVIMWTAFRRINSPDWLMRGLAIGALCGSFGLLLNAVYIDVFAASKVAESYWGIAGLFFAMVMLDKQLRQSQYAPAITIPSAPVQASPVAVSSKSRTTHIRTQKKAKKKSSRGRS